MLDLGWEISFSFIPLGQCKRLQWCRRHLKIRNSTKCFCYIFDPNLVFAEICPCQGLLGGGFQTKAKLPLRQPEGYQHSRPHHCQAILQRKVCIHELNQKLEPARTEATCWNLASEMEECPNTATPNTSVYLTDFHVFFCIFFRRL